MKEEWCLFHKKEAEEIRSLGAPWCLGWYSLTEIGGEEEGWIGRRIKKVALGGQTTVSDALVNFTQDGGGGEVEGVGKRLALLVVIGRVCSAGPELRLT